MAKERSAARQPKIVKKEPSVAVAKSAQAPAPSAEEAAPDHWVHLDIPAALPGISINDNMQIILEGVPDGARLSAGRNNGDKTWSLAPDELVDLGFLPPSGRDAEGQSFFVRLLTFDPDGYQIASTTAQVAFTMDGVAASRRIRGRRRTDQGEPTVDAIRDIEFSERLAAAEAAWKAGEEQRLAEALAAWEAEARARLAALEETLLNKASERHEQEQANTEASFEERLKAAEAIWVQQEEARTQENHERLWQEYSRRLREAETEWHREESERMSAALAQAADFTAQRLSAAEEQWQIESDKRLAQLEAEWRAEAERQVDLARRQWESEANARSPTTASSPADGMTPEAVAQQIAAATASVQADVERHYLERLAAAEASAAQRVADVEAAWRPEREELLARLAGSNDEAVMERLAAAETIWRQETERRVTEAKEAMRAEGERHLAEVTRAWRAEMDHRVSTALQAGGSGDDAGQLELMRSRLSEVEKLAVEAERRIAAREADLERKFDENLTREIERQVAEQQRELERLFTERQLVAEAEFEARTRSAAEQNARLLADNEAAWHEAQAAQLRAAEEVWREEETVRLRAMQDGWREAEAERLHTAEKAWRDGETSRLKEAEAKWQSGETARLAAAESKWRAAAEERLASTIAAERKMLAGGDVARILAEAEGRWKQAEIVRLAEAEVRWKFAEDQRVAEATAQAREEIERLVEARLHRELAVDARRVVSRSGRPAIALGRHLRTASVLIALAAAGLAGYHYLPEIRSQIERSVPAAVATPPVSTERIPSATATEHQLFAAEFANMRADPSSTARIVSTLDKGARLVELERTRGWVKVVLQDGSGTQGWVHGSLVRPTPPPSR